MNNVYVVKECMYYTFDWSKLLAKWNTECTDCRQPLEWIYASLFLCGRMVFLFCATLHTYRQYLHLVYSSPYVCIGNLDVQFPVNTPSFSWRKSTNINVITRSEYIYYCKVKWNVQIYICWHIWCVLMKNNHWIIPTRW